MYKTGSSNRRSSYTTFCIATNLYPSKKSNKAQTWNFTAIGSAP